MKNSILVKTGSYLPEKVLTNDDLAKMVDTNDAWITERTGIKKRHIAADTEKTSDLALKAAKDCLEGSGFTADQIDLIIVATATPDAAFPSVAARVQQGLGAKNAFGFDLSAACCGFIYGLVTADTFIKSGQVKTVLVIGAEALSRILDWTDRSTCVLFGDGAGAFLLTASDDPHKGILTSAIHLDGDKGDILFVDGGAGSSGKHGFLRMHGQEVFKHAVNNLSAVVTEILEKTGLTSADIDLLVPHQANSRIMNAVARKMNLSEEQLVSTVADHGNTSAASIPLAFDCAVKQGRVREGQTILMEAIGGGLTWGALVLRT